MTTPTEKLAARLERYRMSPICDNGSDLDALIVEVVALLRSQQPPVIKDSLTTQQPGQDEREAFEAWWRTDQMKTFPYHDQPERLEHWGAGYKPKAWLAWQAARLSAPQAAGQWLDIATAPRGSGENGPGSVTHPDYVEPPKLLLNTAEGVVVGYYDWYYHPGYGRGAEPGVSAWRDSSGGQAYAPTHWMPLPEPPTPAGEGG
jgi:hypothetical protein